MSGVAARANVRFCSHSGLKLGTAPFPKSATTGHHQPEQPSFPKIKLEAQFVGDFIDSPLKANRIARRRNNRRLPAISMVFANTDINLADAQRSDDHVG